MPSCGLPKTGDASNVMVFVWPCSKWGLPCRLCCQRRGALLPHHFTLTRARQAIGEHVGGVFSAALSITSRRPGVTRHFALWSPDFPPANFFAGDRSANLPRRIITALQNLMCYN